MGEKESTGRKERRLKVETIQNILKFLFVKSLAVFPVYCVWYIDS